MVAGILQDPWSTVILLKDPRDGAEMPASLFGLLKSDANLDSMDLVGLETQS